MPVTPEERKDKKWETLLSDSAENQEAKDLYEYLWLREELPRKSRYGFVRYMLHLGNRLIMNDTLVSVRDVLFKNKVIPEKTLLDAFELLVLLGIDRIKEEYPDAIA